MQFNVLHLVQSVFSTKLVILPLISAVVSSITSQAGISGAFLLLPVQISFLGVASPVASSTNLFYNVISTPGGVYRYWRENRLNTRLAFLILLGTIPGMLTGVYVRVNYLPDPHKFRIFAGFVLMYMAFRLLLERKRSVKRVTDVTDVKLRPQKLTFSFDGKVYSVESIKLVPTAFLIGTVAGAYGVGGGAFLAPLLVTTFSLPVYTISGAVLLSTFVTSLLSIIFYSGLGYPPNLVVGIAFGLGGFAGMYLGARAQKRVNECAIRTILGIVVLAIALKYVLS